MSANDVQSAKPQESVETRRFFALASVRSVRNAATGGEIEAFGGGHHETSPTQTGQFPVFSFGDHCRADGTPVAFHSAGPLVNRS